LSFDPAAALLRAVNILDIPHSKRLASGPNYGAIFGQIFFSEALRLWTVFKGEKMELLIMLAVIVVWVVLQVYILPKMGIST
jgi:hypothetical protein